VSDVSPPAAREAPRFRGVVTHRDPRGRFSIRHASDWRVFSIRSDEPAGASAAGADVPTGGRRRRRRRAKDGIGSPVAAREGIGFAPNPHDPHTVFTAWASPLGATVAAEDLEQLRAAVDEGLRGLEECSVEQASDLVLGNLIRFERIYTFRERQGPDDPGAVRQRRQWLLYVAEWLICLIWQGSSPEEYRHWLAMANYSFFTFEIPTELWFFAERHLLTQPQPSGPAAAQSSPEPDA
jgi:hypothetical protein